MKESLLELIDRTDEIEKLFHVPKVDSRIAMLSSEIIHDVQEFSIWIQGLKCELQEIYGRTHDKFIGETIEDVSADFKGWQDKEMFNKIKGDLVAIEKNVDSYYPQNEQMGVKFNGDVATKSKESKIFISHSSEDKDDVEKIVDLLKNMGLNEQQIFCTSVPGNDIPIGEGILKNIRSQFEDYNLYFIFVHSKSYYKSSVCLNEMGAAWILKLNYTSILLPDFNFCEMNGVVRSDDIAIKLDANEYEVKDKLNQLYDILIKVFNLPKQKSIVWEQARDKFISKFKKNTPNVGNLPYIQSVTITEVSQDDVAENSSSSDTNR